jgi:glycine C-acetyltransferase
MPVDRLHALLASQLEQMTSDRRKGFEKVIDGVIPAEGTSGPRYRVAGQSRPFIRMNSNSYLGLATHPRLVAAAEQAVQRYGVGPGAVRFISGTLQPHADLEAALSAFHGREAAMIFSSAYATVVSVIVSLVTPQTVVISDELNHNSIINAIKLARPQARHVYRHLDMMSLEQALQQAAGEGQRAIVITDGIFSMRGVHAPLQDIVALIHRYDDRFAENAILVVDDSHGVGAFGTHGRGTEEYTSTTADVLIGTLGKAFGVNGGYVTGSQVLIDSLRETSPMYIYSNPITPGEAAAARAAVALVDSDEGHERLEHLRHVTAAFREGLERLKLETLAGEHPVVPLFVRDTQRTAALVEHLFERGVLATGIVYPVVPRGDESIRFQVSAEHTLQDIDDVLAALRNAFRAIGKPR